MHSTVCGRKQERLGHALQILGYTYHCPDRRHRRPRKPNAPLVPKLRCVLGGGSAVTSLRWSGRDCVRNNGSSKVRGRPSDAVAEREDCGDWLDRIIDGTVGLASGVLDAEPGPVVGRPMSFCMMYGRGVVLCELLCECPGRNGVVGSLPGSGG